MVRKYGDLIEVTTRTFQGRLLLRPSPQVNEIVLGVLGRALARGLGVGVVAFVFMSNHYHLLLRVPHVKALSEFVNYINSNIARKVGRLHGWRDRFWGRRYRGIQVVDDISAEERLRYVLSHGAKEGLVARPGQWPGAHCHEALLEGEPLEGVWFDWTSSYNQRRRGKEVDPYAFSIRYPVPLVPLPGWEGFSEAERRSRCAAMVADIERDTRAQNRALGRRAAGVRFVLNQEPHSMPEEVKRAPAPPCHAASRERREEYCAVIREFVTAYRAAFGVAVELFEKKRDLVAFPPDCFPPALPYVPPSTPQPDVSGPCRVPTARAAPLRASG